MWQIKTTSFRRRPKYLAIAPLLFAALCATSRSDEFSVCTPPPTPATETQPITRSRYFAVRTDSPDLLALRVIPTHLAGQPVADEYVRWVGPVHSYPDEDANNPGRQFHAAQLQCNPHVADFGSIDLLFVYGPEVLPDSEYLIQAIAAECALPPLTEENFSTPLIATTGVWGDVVEPFGMSGGGNSQPNFDDIAAVISKFIQDVGAPEKTQAQLQPATLDPDQPIQFRDIAAAVSAFLSEPYPYSPGDPCDCPSQCMLSIESGDTWRYFKGTEEPPANWAYAAFDDASWAFGPTGIGFGDGDDATVLHDMQGEYATVFARRLFHVDRAGELTALTLSIAYDDGFVAYVNGVEHARSPSMMGQGTPPAYDALANTANHEATAAELFDLSDAIPALVDGTNVLAVQVHNRSLDSSDCSMIPLLSASTDCFGDWHCDDGVFCNGIETCHTITGQCMVGAIPCDAPFCDEDIDECGEFTCPVFDAGVQIGSLQRTDVLEASGLAASRKNPGVLWTHDDSGGGNEVFAINIDGTLLGTYRLGIGSVRDAEDMAIGPGPSPNIDYLFLGDIGDNDSVRTQVIVKRAPEPFVDALQLPVAVTLGDVDIIRLQYPTGEHAPTHTDAETLFVDTNGDIYVVMKRMMPNKVYRAPFPQSTSSVTTLEYVATLPTGTGLDWITAGDLTSDGRWLIMRNERAVDFATVWFRGAQYDIAEALASQPCLIPLMAEPLGEAIAWDSLGLGFFTTSEAYHITEPIWYYGRQ